MKAITFLAQSCPSNLPPGKVCITGLPHTPIDIGNILSTAFVVAGAMATLFILIGAVRYAIATGDSGQLKQARDTILYALIGLVVALSGFFIVQFVLGSVA